MSEKYKILDNGMIVDEEYLRRLLFEYEISDIENNKFKYFEGIYDLKHQFNCIKGALEFDISEIIRILESSWNVPIEKLKEGK